MRQTQPTNTLTKIGFPEASQILNKTEIAVRKAVERGLIPYRRMGRHIFFFREELYAFLENSPGLTLEEILKQRRG